MMNELFDAIIMIIKPSLPYFEWMSGLPVLPENKLPDLDALSQDTICLIQPKPELDKFNEFLIEHASQILQHEFSRWSNDRTMWPLRNDVEILLEYFHLEIYQNIVDYREKPKQYQRIVILKPTAELKAWLLPILQSLGKEVDRLTPESFQRVTTAYVLPDSIKTLAGSVQWMQTHCRDVLEYELNRYITDKKYWPKQRDLALLTRWFEMDVYQNPIEYRGKL